MLVSGILQSDIVLYLFIQSCPTLCDPINRGMPGLLVHHHVQEFTQIHVHRVGDAMQSSHPLSSAGVQPQWIQGIQSGDVVGEDQETIA